MALLSFRGIGTPSLPAQGEQRRSSYFNIRRGNPGPKRGVALRLRRVCRCAGHLAKRGYKHLAIAERGDPQVAKEYLPIIHLVFANLKTWLNGTHHGVSHQHLQAYLNEFTFRFNRRFYPFNAFRSLLGIAGDVTAPTYAELYSGAWQHPTCWGCG
jgi:ISXO2-like transposase domain